MLQTFVHTLQHSLTIVTFVVVMMLLIEYLTVRTQNRFLFSLESSSVKQIIFAALLGIIPGCLGTFFAVSLYTHKVLKLPALITVMIATSGDEAFVMFGEIPKQAIILNLILFAVAIATGLILNIFWKEKNFTELKVNMLHSHSTPQCVCFDKNQFKKDWQNLSFERGGLTFSISVILVFVIGNIANGEVNFESITFLITLALALYIVVTVPEHFLHEHLWKHTIKKHFLRIFLWTFGTLLFVEMILPLLNITQEAFLPIAQKYFWLILIIAVAVGIIPESGPNLVFVFLFSQGYVPFSILLANSAVQDGHGSLPLLAESRKSFFIAKGVNIIVGLLVGLVGYFIGF